MSELELQVNDINIEQSLSAQDYEVFMPSTEAYNREDELIVSAGVIEHSPNMMLRTIGRIMGETVENVSDSVQRVKDKIANIPHVATALMSVGAIAITGSFASGALATKGKKTCPPNKVELNLVGPDTISPNVTDHLTAQITACPTIPAKKYGSVRLVELGPLPKEKKSWSIKDLKSDSTKAEHLNLSLSKSQMVKLAQANKSKSEGSITLEAFDAHHKLLAISRTILHAAPPSPGKGVPVNNTIKSTPVNMVIGPSGQATCPIEQVPGIYLCGESSVSLGKPSSYQIEVVSPDYYKNAAVGIISGSANYDKAYDITLNPDSPWLSDVFTLDFTNAKYLASNGAALNVNVPIKPNSQIYKNLFSEVVIFTPDTTSSTSVPSNTFTR